MASSSGGAAGGSSEAERRLCRLVTRSLGLIPHDPSPSLTPESERDLLISLSSVSREIQRWTDEVDSSDSEQDEEASFRLNDVCDYYLTLDHVCLVNVVSLLVAFLTIKSSYVRHLVGNTLVIIYKFLASSESSLVEFLRLLWTTFETSLLLLPSQLSVREKNLMLTYPPVKNRKSGALHDDNHDTVDFVASLQPVLPCSSCHMVTNLIRVLHIILKHIKLDHSDLMEMYIRLALCSLSKIPWDSFSIQKGDDSLVDQYIRAPGLTYLTYGALLQLVCSLVDQKVLEEVGGLDDSETYSKFTGIVLKLLSCSLSSNEEHNCMHIFQYLRHKALMLMYRLSFWNYWKPSSILLWLKLLREYFEDLLYGSMSKCHAKHNSSPEGSPFHTNIIDRENIDKLCTCHLQRQATLLFLRCCFQLFHLEIKAVQEHDYVTETSTCVPEMQLYKKESCDEGLAELSEWLKKHAFLEKYLMGMEDEEYSMSCCRFALTFLHLYMDEDDMLFEILLQLLKAPFLTMQDRQDIGNIIHDKMKKETMLHMSNIFNPIHLFHLFLSLLQYDHLVLLDYLISKDVGVQCLQYLLRCLRIVCRSWAVFVEFSKCENEIAKIPTKKMKISVGGKDYGVNIKHLSTSQEDFASNGLMEGDRRRKVNSGHNVKVRAFEDAKDCLLSLKVSIEVLHKKNLFPYNPTVLLRSFTRFQELCQEQVDVIGDGKVAEGMI